MKLKVKKLHKDAVLPSYSKVGDAGMDLTAVERTQTAGYTEYRTGLSFEIPEGYVGLLFPRSSISNKDLSLANAVGVLDSGYRGEVSFRFKRTNVQVGCGDRLYNDYAIGDRIGQLLVIPYPKIELEMVDELSGSERGAGSYGSSGH